MVSKWSKPGPKTKIVKNDPKPVKNENYKSNFYIGQEKIVGEGPFFIIDFYILVILGLWGLFYA